MTARPTAGGFRSVVFDCDSTLVRVEGIDELAGVHAAAVRKLTEEAMDGAVRLEEVYARRLALIRPDRDAVDAIGDVYRENLVADARETIAALRWLGKEVRVVSGGLRPAVVELAAELGLGEDAVAAVGLRYDEQGVYVGLEEPAPLARAGGKAGVIRGWDLPRPILLVGDGMTDLEARPAVDGFAAFTGVVRREAVAEAADYVIEGDSLAPVLWLAAGGAERARLARSPWAALLPDDDARSRRRSL